MKIAVFCSANKNIDPDFFTLTEEMGKWMAENGHDLVFGGCNSGLMDCIGKAVKAHGGRTIGVVPTLVERGGRTFPDLDIEIPCDNLSDRKDLLQCFCARSTINYPDSRKFAMSCSQAHAILVLLGQITHFAFWAMKNCRFVHFYYLT